MNTGWKFVPHVLRRTVRSRGRARRSVPFVFVFVFAFAFALLAGASGAVAAEPLERALRALLTRLPHAKATAGACVLDAETGRVVFAYRADAPMIPASTMKVFTMASALDVLGAGFTFRTVCAVDGDRLVLIGDGDPALGDARLGAARGEAVTTELQRWADALAKRGIHALDGGVVLDESIFDAARVHPSWEPGDLQKWYAAPVGALNFNDNCVDITVRPGARDGAPARWSVVPPNDVVRILNGCVTGGSRNPILHHPWDSFDYRISGACQKSWAFAPVSVPDPGALLAGALRRVFAERGVRVSNVLTRERVRAADGSVPSSLRVVALTETPLSDVLRRIGKDSQNLFAECLLKRVGYAWSHRRAPATAIGSWETGRDAMHATLMRAGVDTSGMTLADGSGLSRDNRCTARQLARTLAWIRHHPDGRIVLQALSVTGVDGSLKRSMPELKGRVSAKTGTMTGVRALAGFVAGGDGREYAFAILFNGYPGSSTPYKHIQYRFCQTLAASSGP